MRIVLLLLVGWFAAPALRADEPPLYDFTDDTGNTPPAPGDPIKRFDGRTTLTTADFKVPDGWELRWHSDQILSIGVIRLDNTVVAGTTGRTVGSLYVPQGGAYRLRIKTTDPVPWDVAVYAIDTAPADEASYMPTVGPAFKPVKDTAPPPAPAPAPVAAAPKPAPPVAAPLPMELSLEQKQSMVTIKGDRLQGSGFFMKHGGDTVLVTTQHLIADNPNWRAISANGAPVQVTRIQGAADRDLAMLSVKDFGYSALPEGDPTKLQPGDKLLTASRTGVPLAPVVASVDEQRILVDTLHPFEGSPLVLARNGRVVGLIGIGPRLLRSDNFSPDNFTTRDNAVLASIGPYVERLDDVSSWETCQPAQLQAEAEFISNFRHHSRQLDAYLNGGGEPRNRALWKSDDKIAADNATFLGDTPDGNAGQRTQSLHALLFELGVVCDTDLDQMQMPSNFYSYQRSEAQEETAYRQALKAEIDQFGSDTSRFDPIVRRNNTASDTP